MYFINEILLFGAMIDSKSLPQDEEIYLNVGKMLIPVGIPTPTLWGKLVAGALQSRMHVVVIGEIKINW